MGPVTVGGTPVTSWYWYNTGTSVAPTVASVAVVTATNFNPASNGWSTGTGWNGDVTNDTAGYAWFRTTLPASASAPTIYFTDVLDSATVYLNGTNVVGTSSAPGFPFSVSLSGYWSTTGTNVLTVLVQDTGGVGGIPGSVILNPLPAAIAAWKMQGGIGLIENPSLAWGAVGATGTTPAFYHATFAWQQPAGVLPILRAAYGGLSSGHIWLNGHPLGRYPEIIPINGLYLPECWLSATNTIDYFDEQGNSPGAVNLFVETAASRQVYQGVDVGGAMVYPPEDITANAENGKVSLIWNAVTGATGYNIMRSTTSGGPYTLLEPNLPGFSFADTDVQNGTTYYYVISAVNGNGQTGNSIEVNGTPTLVTPQVANPGFELPGTVKIQTGFSMITGWSNAGSAYANSGVQSTPAAHGGSWSAFCNGNDGGAYQITDYQLQQNDKVTLTWWAEHSGGSGASTQTVSMLGAPSQTSAYSSTAVLTSTTGAVNGYGSGAGPWAQYTLTYTATGSAVGDFVGLYFNNATPGNWSSFDDFSVGVVSTPYAPLGLSGSSGDRMVNLNWSPSSSASSYNLKRGLTSGSCATIASISGTAYTDTGLTDGVTYYYTASAVNNTGEGLNADPIDETPSAAISVVELNNARIGIPAPPGMITGMSFRSSVPGHTYTLQYSSGLSPTTWTNVGSAVAGTGGTIQMPAVTITGSSGFYRILIQRE